MISKSTRYYGYAPLIPVMNVGESCARMAMVEVKSPVVLDDYRLAQTALQDPKAEEQLLRRVYPKILQIARCVVGSHRQADDIAQLAAMEVVRSLAGFTGTGSIEAWAGRIACRVTMKTLRRDRHKERLFVPLADESIPGDDDTENPETTVTRRQLFEILIAKMETIPAKRRVPLLLHLAHGYTVSEVAELTEVSPNTVKDRLKTAYRELRAILDAHPRLRAAMVEELS